MIQKDKCWWFSSNQCQEKACKLCYMFYPILKGMLNEPSYEIHKNRKLLEMLVEAEHIAHDHVKGR